MIHLPSELITYITSFLSSKDRETARETCKEIYCSINLIGIKAYKFDYKIDQIMDGRIYMLNRLRLAALCGLDKKSVSAIWLWIMKRDFSKEDGLRFLRQIGASIH